MNPVPFSDDERAALWTIPQCGAQLGIEVRHSQAGKKVKAIKLSGEWAYVRDPEVPPRLNQGP